MTRTESWIQLIFFISCRYFNQLDTTSNVTYRHEISCTGNTAYSFNLNIFVCEQCSSGKFVDKVNGDAPSSDTIPPPPLPTISFDFPALTFNPLTNKPALHSTYLFFNSSPVVTIRPRSSAYSHSQGSSLLTFTTTSITIQDGR